jgi:spore coat polysaccharide biosynthesis predicted glycosyltransferase SpsG
MGGSDAENAMPTVLRAFEGTDLAVTAIIGPGFTNRNEIERTVSGMDTDISLAADPDDLPERMFDADFAVSAAGSTVYELLATGTPTIGIPQVPNQEPIARALANRGAILYCGETAVDPITTRIETMCAHTDVRRSLRERGRLLVDGRGQQRVYRRLTELRR